LSIPTLIDRRICNLGLQAQLTSTEEARSRIIDLAARWLHLADRVEEKQQPGAQQQRQDSQKKLTKGTPELDLHLPFEPGHPFRSRPGLMMALDASARSPKARRHFFGAIRQQRL
jgi:hypothetical protein